MTAVPGSVPGDDRHVVLIGRAGPLRTSIGRRTARLLQRPFADVDEQLELDAGRTLARLGREHGPGDVRRREVQVLAGLLARRVSLVILAPDDRVVCQRTSALLARSAVVLALRDEAARASLVDVDGVDDRDVADHVIDLEFQDDIDEPGRAVSRLILQLFVAGELRGTLRVPDDVKALSDGLLDGDVALALTRWEDELSARFADIAELGIDVEPLGNEAGPADEAIARHIARLLAAEDPPHGTTG